MAWSIAQHPQLALAAVLFLYSTNAVIGRHGVIEQTRTFYGTYRIFGNAEQHTFVHGTTVHGTQFADARRRDVPTTYYSEQGPLGDVFSVANESGFRDVGAVGLGAGTLAAYGRTGQHFTFFEIDPEVVRIAKDPHLFTYLKDSPASVTTVTGDGRLNLAKVPPRSFDLVILDAFSSDAIPVHLLTQEAVHDYADRLETRRSAGLPHHEQSLRPWTGAQRRRLEDGLDRRDRDGQLASGGRQPFYVGSHGAA